MAFANSVLGRQTETFSQLFEMGKELGRGQFGITRQCIERKTGTVHACKLIAKSRLQPNDYILREVQIMHHLVGHPHVVKIVGAYEDPRRVYIVMELCTGGELFDRIVANGRFSEMSAAAQIADIVGVVQHCHQLGVMHLDLKPENFLLASEDQDALLKVTDFGLSRFFKVGEVYTEEVGSLIYKAPEVLRCRYGPEADIWSAGVILYILLCGYPPFKGENDVATRELIKRGPLNFEVAPWPQISESAKDLVSHMLDREPRRRFTANEVLNHPWISEEGVAADRDIDCAVLQRLKQFSATNKLQKMALKVIADNMTPEEIRGLELLFESMDVDHSGTITLDELQYALKQQGSWLVESEVQALLDAADIDHDGTIDYDEFIAATMHFCQLEKEEHLLKAFHSFDHDNNGYITKEELEKAIQVIGLDTTEDESAEEIIKVADEDNDGVIDYKEFQTMMRRTSSQASRASKSEGVPSPLPSPNRTEQNGTGFGRR